LKKEELLAARSPVRTALLLWWALFGGRLLWVRPEEKKTSLLACLVREKKMCRLWLGERDVRSADG
jgi:hypothetical protein